MDDVDVCALGVDVVRRGCKDVEEGVEEGVGVVDFEFTQEGGVSQEEDIGEVCGGGDSGIAVCGGG